MEEDFTTCIFCSQVTYHTVLVSSNYLTLTFIGEIGDEGEEVEEVL